MKIPMSAVVSVVETVLRVYCRKAVKYLDDHTIVRATRRGAFRKNARTTELVLTVGKPNYSERRYIRLLKAAGQSFPVNKIQLR
jgi:hypothetical protein